MGLLFNLTLIMPTNTSFRQDETIRLAELMEDQTTDIIPSLIAIIEDLDEKLSTEMGNLKQVERDRDSVQGDLDEAKGEIARLEREIEDSQELKGTA